MLPLSLLAHLDISLLSLLFTIGFCVRVWPAFVQSFRFHQVQNCGKEVKYICRSSNSNWLAPRWPAIGTAGFQTVKFTEDPSIMDLESLYRYSNRTTSASWFIVVCCHCHWHLSSLPSQFLLHPIHLDVELLEVGSILRILFPFSAINNVVVQ